MDAIVVLIGLVIGVLIFLALMDHITAIIYSCQSVAVTFLFCWGIGIVLAWISWKIAIIIGIIALILYLISKFAGHKESKNEENDDVTPEKIQENKNEEIAGEISEYKDENIIEKNTDAISENQQDE